MLTKIFVFVNIFSKIQSLREIIGILNIFARMLTKKFVFVNTSAKLSRIREIYVFQILSWSGCPVQVTYQADLSSKTCFWLSCPSCSVPNVLSKMSWPDLSVLSWLSCPSCPAPAALPGPPCPLPSWFHFHVLAVLFSLYFPDWPVQSNLSGWLVVTVLSWLSYPEFPVQTVPSQLSYPRGPVLDVLSQLPRLFHPSCPFLAILSLLPRSGCSA